jgi:hypothetical protein
MVLAMREFLLRKRGEIGVYDYEWCIEARPAEDQSLR